jgi:hypothetical protein
VRSLAAVVDPLTVGRAVPAVFRGHVACRRSGCMNPLTSRSVVLVSGDFHLLNLVAAELREIGCRVFCVRDLQEAAALVRAGATRRFVLVRLGAEVFSSEELRRAMADHLPDYAIRGDEGEEAWAALELESLRQPPN